MSGKLDKLINGNEKIFLELKDINGVLVNIHKLFIDAIRTVLEEAETESEQYEDDEHATSTDDVQEEIPTTEVQAMEIRESSPVQQETKTGSEIRGELDIVRNISYDRGGHRRFGLGAKPQRGHLFPTEDRQASHSGPPTNMD